MKSSWLFEKDVSNFVERRKRMMQGQLVLRGIRDRRVLEAMNSVPREQFVPRQLQSEAYEDRPLPIGFGQTISQPFTVAFMTEALRLDGSERVLEIGTGTGYAAAVLGCLAEEVHTGNGTLGLPGQAPFDAITVTAGADELPEPYVEQLADSGRIVIPIGGVPTRQSLFRFTRRGPGLHAENLGRFAFVPLIGQHGWSDASAL